MNLSLAPQHNRSFRRMLAQGINAKQVTAYGNISIEFDSGIRIDPNLIGGLPSGYNVTVAVLGGDVPTELEWHCTSLREVALIKETIQSVLEYTGGAQHAEASDFTDIFGVVSRGRTFNGMEWFCWPAYAVFDLPGTVAIVASADCVDCDG